MKPRAITVIVPAFNEEANVEPLFEEIKEVLEGLKGKIISSYGIIFVNDGSTDETEKVLTGLKSKNKSILKIISLRKNFGQTAALKAGFDNSSGDLIITLDSDMQNDPRDIPRLIEHLDKGYDVVSGWRYNRKDKFSKRITSRMMNNLRQIVIGDNLHDYGCSLKIYKKECLKDLELFGELHRYITAYLHIKGYRIGEIKVNHRPRRAGKTKYRLSRGLNGILDLFYFKYWSTYASRPFHLFGRLGLYQWVLAFMIVIEQIIKGIILDRLTFGPLLALASMLAITGLLFIIFGFLSETMSRTYFKDNKIYSVREKE